MWLHAGQVRLYWPFGLLEYSLVSSSVVSVTFRHLHYLSQVYFTTLRAEGKQTMSQLGDGAWLKVSSRANVGEIFSLSVANPGDGLIP